MKLVFRILNSPLKGLTYDTDKDVISIGRSSKNDLVLKQNSVSRFHAVIKRVNGTVVLEDAGSKNATRIDGAGCGGSSEVVDGSIMTFGDVAVLLSMPENAPANGEDEEVTPEGAVMAAAAEQGDAGFLSGSVDLPSAAGPIETAPSAAAAEAERTQPLQISGPEGRLWAILAAALGMAAALSAGVFFLNYTGAGDRPVAELGASLRVGELKILEVPSGFIYNPQVSPPDLVRISRPLQMNMAIAVEAVSQGMATAVLHDRGGNRMLLHINVLPAAVRPAAAFALPAPQQREDAAREKMLLAESLRIDGRKYEAKKLYEEVADMLYAMGGDAHILRRSAEEKRRTLAAEIEKSHEELRFEISAMVKMGRKRNALSRLEDVMELIPDEGDLRHQNARMLHRMLSGIIERESR